jgi:hypothetical protein
VTTFTAILSELRLSCLPRCTVDCSHRAEYLLSSRCPPLLRLQATRLAVRCATWLQQHDGGCGAGCRLVAPPLWVVVAGLGQRQRVSPEEGVSGCGDVTVEEWSKVAARFLLNREALYLGECLMQVGVAGSTACCVCVRVRVCL